LSSLGLTGFDLVTNMEVIEHVADKAAFIAALSATLADDGLMILSTPNRTAASRLLLIEAAERFGMVPRGTHHWDDFITLPNWPSCCRTPVSRWASRWASPSRL
jgi:2-polyprenyl-6-hydroxyphenyl methylase/3-demethylubiquinone-9 3-methyltransferase